MYNDFDDYDYERYEPPSEFMTKIDELVKEEVVNNIKSKIEDLNSYITQEKELRETLRITKNQLRDLENKHKIELQQALKDKEIEVQRKLGVGFAVNDTVYYIETERSYTKCDKCNGKYEMKVEVLGKETNVRCPHCSCGQVMHCKYYPKQDIISSIKFYISRKEWRNNKSLGELTEDKNIEMYLEKSEGYKNRGSLYHTEEECQAVIDKMYGKQV